ncbi:MAG: acyltransferase, partial [Rhodospirillales bacterium]|nr:acyltransferase [Rhodospirillales bacterium]
MQQITPRLNDERLDYLDGLRGIAVLMVVLSHTSNNGLHIVPFLNMAGSGKVGVWLFFVLSAFLLTRKLDGKARRGGLTPGVCAEYAVHRVARIMPLLTLVLLGYLAAGRFTAQHVVEHLLLLRGDFIFWAIPVECYYYVVIPILVWTYDTVFRKRFGAFLALLVPLAIAGHVLFPPSLAFNNSINLLVYLSVFLCGSIIALTVTDPPRGLRPSRMATLAAGSCVFLLTPSILNGVLESLG